MRHKTNLSRVTPCVRVNIQHPTGVYITSVTVVEGKLVVTRSNGNTETIPLPDNGADIDALLETIRAEIPEPVNTDELIEAVKDALPTPVDERGVVTGRLVGADLELLGEGDEVLATVELASLVPAAKADRFLSAVVYDQENKQLVFTTEADGDDAQTIAVPMADVIPVINVASTTQRGIVELATLSEAKTGTATNLAVTPAGLTAALAETKGAVENANQRMQALEDSTDTLNDTVSGLQGSITSPSDLSFDADTRALELQMTNGQTFSTTIPTDDALAEAVKQLTVRVDGLKSGGRNYLRGCGDATKWWHYTKREGSSVGVITDDYIAINNAATSNHWKQLQQFGYAYGAYGINEALNELVIGDDIVINGYVKNTSNKPVTFYSILRYDVTSGSTADGLSLSLVAEANSDWTYFEVKGKMGGSLPENYKGNRFILLCSEAFDGELSFKQLQVAKGTVASDWTPAPECADGPAADNDTYPTEVSFDEATRELVVKLNTGAALRMVWPVEQEGECTPITLGENQELRAEVGAQPTLCRLADGSVVTREPKQYVYTVDRQEVALTRDDVYVSYDDSGTRVPIDRLYYGSDYTLFLRTDSGENVQINKPNVRYYVRDDYPLLGGEELVSVGPFEYTAGPQEHQDDEKRLYSWHKVTARNDATRITDNSDTGAV